MEDHEALNIEHSITPCRLSNSAYRDREHLTKPEIDELLKAARGKVRNSHRDYCIILLGYKHGLRAIEFTWLKWENIDLDRATIYIKRAKGSDDGTHHLTGTEVRELRRLRRYQDSKSRWVFTSETGDPLTPPAISRMVKRLGEVKGGKYLLGFPVHAHMLRHTCGYLLAASGVDIRITQAWMGHRELQNTVRYTKLSPHAFRNIDI